MASLLVVRLLRTHSESVGDPGLRRSCILFAAAWPVLTLLAGLVFGAIPDLSPVMVNLASLFLGCMVAVVVGLMCMLALLVFTDVEFSQSLGKMASAAALSAVVLLVAVIVLVFVPYAPVLVASGTAAVFFLADRHRLDALCAAESRSSFVWFSFAELGMVLLCSVPLALLLEQVFQVPAAAGPGFLVLCSAYAIPAIAIKLGQVAAWAAQSGYAHFLTQCERDMQQTHSGTSPAGRPDRTETVPPELAV